MGTGDWGKGKPIRKTPLNSPCGIQVAAMLLAIIAGVVWLFQ